MEIQAGLDDGTPHTNHSAPEWADQLNLSCRRYEPRPSLAKICLYLPNELRKAGGKDAALTGFVRNALSQYCGLTHDPDSPYVIDVHLIANQRGGECISGEGESSISSTTAQPISVPSAMTIDRCTLTRAPLVLTGYYLKRSRTLSQTPMFVDGGRRRVGTGSVQEIICDAILGDFFKDDADLKEKGKAVAFAGAGREDVDVQVFGKGRRFLLTIPEPSRNGLPSEELLRDMEQRVQVTSGDKVRVHSLKVATAEDKKYVLEGAELRRKLYVCVVELEPPMTDDQASPIESALSRKNLIVLQRTPIRVSHRRAMMTRERVVHSVIMATISPTIFIMWIEAGAGFYIKEFVHGDLGRTSPSVSEIFGCKARLITLDFLGAVEDETPPLQSDNVAEESSEHECEASFSQKRQKVNLPGTISLEAVDAQWFW